MHLLVWSFPVLQLLSVVGSQLGFSVTTVTATTTTTTTDSGRPTWVVATVTYDQAHYCYQAQYEPTHFASQTTYEDQVKMASMVAWLVFGGGGEEHNSTTTSTSTSTGAQAQAAAGVLLNSSTSSGAAKLAKVARTLSYSGQTGALLDRSAFAQLSRCELSGCDQMLDYYISQGWFVGGRKPRDAWRDAYLAMVGRLMRTHYHSLEQLASGGGSSASTDNTKAQETDAKSGLVKAYCGVERYLKALYTVKNFPSEVDRMLNSRQLVELRAFFRMLVQLLLMPTTSTTTMVTDDVDEIIRFVWWVRLWGTFHCTEIDPEKQMPCERMLREEFASHQQNGPNAALAQLTQLPTWFQAGEGVLIDELPQQPVDGTTITNALATMAQTDFRQMLTKTGKKGENWIRGLTQGEERMLSFRYQALVVLLQPTIQLEGERILREEQWSTPMSSNVPSNVSSPSKCGGKARCSIWSSLGVAGLGGGGGGLYYAYPMLVDLWNRIVGGGTTRTTAPALPPASLPNETGLESTSIAIFVSSSPSSSGGAVLFPVLAIIAIVVLVVFIVGAILFYRCPHLFWAQGTAQGSGRKLVTNASSSKRSSKSKGGTTPRTTSPSTTGRHSPGAKGDRVQNKSSSNRLVGSVDIR